MTPTRRQFAASVAAGPIALGRRQFVGTTAFLFTGLMPSASFRAQAQVQSQSPLTDTVLDAITSDFRELRREGDENPGQRRGVLRAVETLTGVAAAHLGQHHDAELKRSIRRQLQQKGRQALVQEIVAKTNKPEITHEKIDAMLTRLERDGMMGVLRDVQKGIKRMRDNMPPDYLQVRSGATQFDFCSDLRWMIEVHELMAAIACTLAAGFAGLNPAADAACAYAMATLAMYYAMRMWYSC